MFKNLPGALGVSQSISLLHLRVIAWVCLFVLSNRRFLSFSCRRRHHVVSSCLVVFYIALDVTKQRHSKAKQENPSVFYGNLNSWMILDRRQEKEIKSKYQAEPIKEEQAVICYMIGLHLVPRRMLEAQIRHTFHINHQSTPDVEQEDGHVSKNNSKKREKSVVNADYAS